MSAVGKAAPSGGVATFNTPLGRVALEGIADRLRDIALFAVAADGREDMLVIAEKLSDMARAERLAVEAKDREGPIAPWALRLKLGLKTTKAARLLNHFLRFPSAFQQRDVLIRSVETTPTSLLAMIWDIRRALTPLGLRTELQRMDDGYLLTRAGMKAICDHCSSEADGPCLPILGSPTAPVSSLDEPPSPSPLGEPSSLFDQTREPSDPKRGLPSDQLAPLVRLILEFRKVGKRATDERLSAKPGLLDILGRLSPLALKLIALFAANPGIFLSRPTLTERADCTDGSLKILILRIRRTFTTAGLPDPIETKWGFGYRLTPDALLTLSQMADQLGLGAPDRTPVNETPDHL